MSKVNCMMEAYETIPYKHYFGYETTPYVGRYDQ